MSDQNTHNNDQFTYAKSGVDINAQKSAHKIIGELITKTYLFRQGKFGEIIGEYGHYAGLIDIGNELCLAMHVDGVGTKVMIAQMMNKYDTIGIDLIAMHANDLICMGAEPVALEDYLAIETVNNDVIYQIMKGLVEGAKQAQMAIIGGETAIMPDIIKGTSPGNGLDLSGMSIGVVNKKNIITGSNIKINDTIIGIMSSGIHSNGYTLARKAFFDLAKLSPFDPLPNYPDLIVGNELLKPTKIYVQPILSLLKKFNDKIHGLAHITGGAFTKLNRLRPHGHDFGFLLNNLPKAPPIFKEIQNITNISDKEMYKTFNMGIGFCIIADPSIQNEIINLLDNFNFSSLIIGKIIKSNKIILHLNENKIFL
ncbi:MAG: phosphoribosylformylglycinamidine cyclo-ligase [Candidatus Helarchaeota archaeon]